MTELERIKQQTYRHLLDCGYSHEKAEGVSDQMIRISHRYSSAGEPSRAIVKNKNGKEIELFL